jgi:hypothetical protein
VRSWDSINLTETVDEKDYLFMKLLLITTDFVLKNLNFEKNSCAKIKKKIEITTG